VHALLSHLSPRLPHVPRVLGFDDQCREILDFLPGRVIDNEAESLSDARLPRVVDAGLPCCGRGLRPSRTMALLRGGTPLVGHNDIAPNNACFEGDDLAGVFDWDLAGPTTPLNELAFIAWNRVPLWRDIGAGSAARLLTLIADTYGGFNGGQLLRAVPARIQLMLDGIPAAAAAGDSGMATLVAQGEPERSCVALAGGVARIPVDCPDGPRGAVSAREGYPALPTR
jgi:hypothetical protein